jgi:isoquinoline 1-oxidoreductase subunit beta
MRAINLSRRDFLKISSIAGAGLVLGVPLRAAKADAFDFATFLSIGTDGIVTVWITKSEMGQGVRSSLPLLVAEELDADLTKVRVRQAHFDAKFGNQGTGGSGSIRSLWKPLRTAGATARAMLVTAAAAKLGVEASTLTVANGVISNGRQSVSFGELAEAASKLEAPKNVTLKDASAFKLIGKKQVRVDDADIVKGKAQYGIDVRVPGMLYAVVAHSPVFGGTVETFDDTATKALPGVKAVVKVDAVGTEMPWAGVAVVATSTWAAIRGREALKVTWKPGAAATETTASLRERMTALSNEGAPIAITGDAVTAVGAAAKKVEAVYEVPFLAHASMEPQNATASVTADGVEIWAPTQFPDRVNRFVSSALGVPPEKVKVNVTLLGGAFGRRINSDYAVEAALISKAVGAPVHLQWTRDDDMQHDYYRGPSVHRVAAGIDASGKLIGWHHRFAGPSRALYNDPATKTPHSSDSAGLTDLHWIAPHVRVEYSPVPTGVPLGAWRAVAHSTNGFVIGAALDELAHAAGSDPIEFYRGLYPAGKTNRHASAGGRDYPFETDRLLRVIDIAREKSGWGSPAPAGRARGFAAYYSFLTYTAHVIEASVGSDGAIRVHRVVCAVDCGTAVNPDGVVAQIEGGVLFGLTAALHGEITVEGGAVQQANFHDYPLMTIDAIPSVEVHVVPSTAAPTGTGEPGLPSVAAALANAVFAATGKRLRSLPLRVTA